MEITLFGRTIHIFTAGQIDKFREILYTTIGTNLWYQTAVACWFIWILLLTVSWFHNIKGRDVCRLLLTRYILYLFSLLCALVFSRPIGDRSIIVWNKSFFMTENVFHETSLLMVVLKYCMLVPFGVMTKKLFNKARINTLIVMALFTGVFIESMKYLLSRGHAARESALLLTVGVLSGIFFESLKNKCHRLRRDNERNY